MKRRTFGAASAGAALIGAYGALTKPAEAAEASFRMGLLTFGSIPKDGRRVLMTELASRGYIEGKNLQVDYRDAVTPETVGAAATELLRLKPDAIVSIGPQAALAVHAQTTTVPIVTVGVSYPVQVGLAQSLRHPGGNVTGITMVVAGGFSGKLLQLLRELNPRTTKIAVMFNSRSPTHAIALSDDVVPSAKNLGIELVLISADSQAEIPKAIDAAVKAKASALLVLADQLYNRPANVVPDLVASAKLPSMYFFRASVAAGGLMSYGPYVEAMYEEVAAYVVKIFRGENPADIPFAQPKKFEFVINTKTAASLGLVLPQSLLLQADELIQ